MPTLNEVEKNYIIEILKNHPNPKEASQILEYHLQLSGEEKKNTKFSLK